MDLASISVDLPFIFVYETYVSIIETVCFITFGTFCGSRRLVLRAGCFGCSGCFVSVVQVVPVVSFRLFR